MLFQTAAKLWALVIAAVVSIGAATGEAAAAGPTMVVLGDSLSAGYGLAADQAFPAQLQKALAARGVAVNMVNAGVSGDTASGGLARLDWSVPEGTDAVIVELGANDALRGIAPQVTQSALDAILSRLKARGIEVLLCGILAPPNLGTDYGRAFNGLFPALAERHGVEFYPFFLDGVAADRSLNQPDGLHPTATGVAVIVERILPKVLAVLARTQK